MTLTDERHSVQASGGLIENIYVVTNPDKLLHLVKRTDKEQLM